MRVLLLYGTTEGQTARIMEAVARKLVALGHAPTLVDANAVPEGLDPARFDALILAASLHAGGYQASVAHFARLHSQTLRARPNAFISVSLSAAGHDPDDWRGLERCLGDFLRRADWEPAGLHHAAGAFRYTQYDFLKRWAMKHIAARRGAPTDTGHDYELTDWAALDRFVETFAAEAGRRTAGHEEAASAAA